MLRKIFLGDITKSELAEYPIFLVYSNDTDKNFSKPCPIIDLKGKYFLELTFMQVENCNTIRLGFCRFDKSGNRCGRFMPYFDFTTELPVKTFEVGFVTNRQKGKIADFNQ